MDKQTARVIYWTPRGRLHVFEMVDRFLQVTSIQHPRIIYIDERFARMDERIRDFWSDLCFHERKKDSGLGSFEK